jgi:hypothetical protein
MGTAWYVWIGPKISMTHTSPSLHPTKYTFYKAQNLRYTPKENRNTILQEKNYVTKIFDIKES